MEPRDELACIAAELEAMEPRRVELYARRLELWESIVAAEPTTMHKTLAEYSRVRPGTVTTALRKARVTASA
jgi:hypothetical protein